MTYTDTTIEVRGRETRVLRGGLGQPLLYLHDTFIVDHPWLELHQRLAVHYDVIMPIHPGCEGSEATGIDNMDDLLFHYLDLCDALELDAPILVGASLGGWVAVEWAVRYTHRLRGIILIDALGLRLPGTTTADVLRLDPEQTRSHLFSNPTSDLAQHLVPNLPSPEVFPALLKARQTLARFAWQFPDNPKLSFYLYRITLPTLIIWGEHDGWIPTVHAHAYHDAIAGSELVVLSHSGHLPQVEQLDACLNAIMTYLTEHGLSEEH